MEPSSSSDAPLTIFLAEDEVAIREVLAAYLKVNPRFKVVGEAGDGREAVDQCLRLRPALLVLDFDLPGLNGLSVCRALAPAAPGIHILIFSSHCDAGTIRQVLQAGALGIVEKSGKLETLLQAIETVGSGRVFFGEQASELLRHSLHEPGSVTYPDSVTLREREVLQLVAEGRSTKEIASRLGISSKTVENHRDHLMTKLGAHNSADLTRGAYRLGLVRMPTPVDRVG